MKTFRLMRSGPGSAAYNMALDEKIFCRYIEDSIPVLRLYGWEAPSFSYGISQEPGCEIDIARCSQDGIQIAQRLTAGGILFHHNEITYSLVCAKTDIGEDKNVFVSYRQICAFLIFFYKSLGLEASFALEADGFKNSADHQLCSVSREKYDIVINSRKIGGNAQKRKRQAIFQHGSIPLTIDWKFVRRYIPSLPEDISSAVTSLSEELKSIPGKEILEQRLIDAAAHVFNANFEIDDSDLKKILLHCLINS